MKENDSEGWNTDSFKADIVGAAQPGQEGIPGRSYYVWPFSTKRKVILKT